MSDLKPFGVFTHPFSIIIIIQYFHANVKFFFAKNVVTDTMHRVWKFRADTTFPIALSAYQHQTTDTLRCIEKYVGDILNPKESQ